MKKRVWLSLLLILTAALSACKAAPEPTEPPQSTEYPALYQTIDAIDHSVVEPDERAAMSDGDRAAFCALTDAMLSRRASVTLDVDASRMDFLMELLHESPYYFFTSGVTVEGTTVGFSYAYGAQEQQQILAFIDGELLAIANSDADPGDNELDVILKIYSAVGRRIEYDELREDNKELGSPLFDYPSDELYKALKDGKSLCYGFAYVLRYALLQRGIDAFCVYGECRAREMGHEWVLVRCGDAFFHCDPAWDRASPDDTKLFHFGKTDAEREADTLVPRPFETYHLTDYPVPVCTDTRFSVFRGVSGYTCLGGHRYRFVDRDGKTSVFDTEEFIRSLSGSGEQQTD